MISCLNLQIKSRGILHLFFDKELQLAQMENVNLKVFYKTSFSNDVLCNWLSSSAQRKRNSAGIWFLRNFSAEWNKLASDGLKLHLNRLFFKGILLWILKVMSWSCVLYIKEGKNVFSFILKNNCCILWPTFLLLLLFGESIFHLDWK